MKLFLEELAKHSVSSLGGGRLLNKNEAYTEAVKKYSELLGKRMLYTCKATREIRVVKVVGVYGTWLRLSYNCYNSKGKLEVFTSVTYSALFSGDDSLGEIEYGA